MVQRYFIFSVGLAIVVGGVILVSCSNIKTINSFSKNGFLIIDKSEFFNPNTKEEYTSIIVTSNSLKSPLILLKTGTDSYDATSLECTHDGQRLDFVNEKLSCSTDGSLFDIKGKVISGPAKKNLKQYWVDKDLLTIKIQIL